MIDWVPNKPINYEKIKMLLEKCEKNKQFTNNGPNVQLLEKFIFDKYKIDENKSVIAVVNASLGLQILTHSINLYHNKDIQWATQSFTFPPSNQGTLKTSTILDIDLEGGLNLNEVNNNINGLIVTNIFGNIVDINKYLEYSKKNDKFLIFDNAATHYTFYNGKNCLNYGHGSVISFHHTKPFGFGEGGAIIVDKKYEYTIRNMINFGIDNSIENKETYYSNNANNCKISDISAVFILQYLQDYFDIIIQKHQDLYNYFVEQKNKNNLNIELFPSFHDKNNICISCFCILFKNKEISLKIKEKLLENNIFCRKYYHPLKETRNACNIYDKILCFPCTKDMNYSDIDFIINYIKN